MSDPSPSSPAWARVRILLNLGDLPAAVSAASAALAVTDFPRGSVCGGPEVVGCPDLPIGWCFLDPSSGMAVVNWGVYDKHCSGFAMDEFVRVIDTLDGPGFVTYDVQSWAIQDELRRAVAGVDPMFW